MFLYCGYGARAGITKLAYSMAEFKNIRYVQGHMMAWRNADLPMEK